MIQDTKTMLLNLQDQICRRLEELDGLSRFSPNKENLSAAAYSNPRVLAGEGRIEKAAVNFTHSIGNSLPTAVSESKKDIAGLPFEAVSLSLIIHPSNPFVPTTHMNLRLFIVRGEKLSWHFGGGYDLTPFYGYVEDAKLWHGAAKDASQDSYANMKKKCDDYFYLPHRGEQRGIGGLFFDDLTGADFNPCFSLVEKIGRSFLPVYEEIFRRRDSTRFTEKNRSFQLFRRGRYAEFNLLFDRGTRYGLQSGRRVESVLASMPPLASWVYEYPIEDDSPEAVLSDYFLKPRNWLEVNL